MSLRISSLCLLASVALLAACGEVSGEPEGPRVECAIGPGADFSDVCTLERISAESFVIHWPDGGFRRFGLEQSEEGPEPTFADGADEISLARTGGETPALEFGMEGERYRLDPALLAAPSDE